MPSTHYCEQCGMLLIYVGNRGFLTGCEHQAADIPCDRLTRRERMLAVAAEREYITRDMAETD